MRELYIGLLSGTSMDGVDAVLADFADHPPTVLAHISRPYPQAVRAALFALCAPGAAPPADSPFVGDALDRLGALDAELGALFADAALEAMARAGVSAAEVRAIGSHGQTIRHRPGERSAHDADAPRSSRFTLQIGDPNRIAERVGATVVADFRRRDMAAGGEGAPLVPPFHACLFRDGKRERAVVNLGGIANVTRLPRDPARPASGFDVGPGNALLDLWAHEQSGATMDCDGALAAAGRLHPPLLDALRADPFFDRPPPKSAGREQFGRAWLGARLAPFAALSAADVQNTLCELTALLVAERLRDGAPPIEEALICGGGVHNRHLMARLAARLDGVAVRSTAAYGVDPDGLEGLAFAWLARERLAGRPANLPAATGARRRVPLGALYPG